MDWQALFSEHIEARKNTVGRILTESGFDEIVIGSGMPGYYFEDDQHWSHRPNHHFNHWCPVPAPGSFIHYRPGQTPILYFHSPRDYWHDSPELGPEFWQHAFQIKIIDHPDEAWSEFHGRKRCLYHGPDGDAASAVGLITSADSGVWARLNWERSFKSAYEVAATSAATLRAARGHQAAKKAFEAGGSEREIYADFLRATGDVERELPYSAIVCLDDKAAILHYTARRADHRQGKVLLIDAGTQSYGYACDITRTWYKDSCPEAFKAIVDGTDKLQLEVCAAAKPGATMVDLHGLAHERIADLLLSVGVFRGLTSQEILAKGLTNAFFPHGIGHMLGLLVHDVAGKQSDAIGTPVPTAHLANDPRFRYLRSHRALAAGNIVTVEPGIYFIPMLLDPLRNSADKEFLNWKLIDDLTPYGGVRIEDDIFVTDNVPRNLTREVMS